ncbi:MAG: CDP-glucose 4,6-dehydratase [Spirochaetia bacterium]|nr:CDP-glucose 4,6-dehydratase [Spirochaetia bacterium]
MSFNNIYKNKKILVTGNTGFKGSWLTEWLLQLNAKVSGLSNGVPTNPSHFETANHKERIRYYEKDIRNLQDMITVLNDVKPDFIFHLAAQPLVRLSYENPVLTMETNIIGTMNVLEALRVTNIKCNAIMITSDKAYDNVEWVWGYRETDHLGGKDPYSASKGAAELIIKTYVESYFKKKDSNVRLAIGRAGNVIGGADWAVDRIVPDAIKAWSVNRTVEIRSPNSTRPWQHVLEPLSGYLLLGQKLAEDGNLNGEPFNFGPTSEQNHSVAELLIEMQKYWPQGEWIDMSHGANKVHEANLLKLNCDKALHYLGWQPVMRFRETVEMTMQWYSSFYKNDLKIESVTASQIMKYEDIARERNICWMVKK